MSPLKHLVLASTLAVATLFLGQGIKAPTDSTQLIVEPHETEYCLQVEENRGSQLGMVLCADTPERLHDMIKAYTGEQYDKGLKSSTLYKAQKLAHAIAQHETGHKNIEGATGELPTKYQFMPQTWKSLAKRYLKDANATPTNDNQDKVAVSHIKALLEQGNTPRQIAMIWNGGKPYRRTGTTTTKSGKVIHYDTGKYADTVLAIYNNL